MSRKNQLNYIPSDKHVLVVGATGTGKSYLAEQYLKGYEYVIKLDTKNETAERYRDGLSPWDGLEEGKHFTVVYRFEDLEEVETTKIIYVMPFEEQTKEGFDQFFNWVFKRENTIVWIDELMSVGTVNSYPISLGRLYQQGRSKGIGIWSCSQRPSGIPSIAPANSNYIFCFNLYLKADRKRMVDATGMDELDTLPEGHNFWFYKMGDRQPTKAVLVKKGG